LATSFFGLIEAKHTLFDLHRCRNDVRKAYTPYSGLADKINKRLTHKGRRTSCIAPAAREGQDKGGSAMHLEDKAELLANVAQIEQHAEEMLAAERTAFEVATLQHIVRLARYMREHLAMLRDTGEAVEKAESLH
jgi:hypothetical protein